MAVRAMPPIRVTIKNVFPEMIDFKFIQQEQSNVNVGDTLTGLPGCSKPYKVLKVMAPLELKRLKKDFLALCKLHPPKNQKSMGDAFLDFLGTRA